MARVAPAQVRHYTDLPRSKGAVVSPETSEFLTKLRTVVGREDPDDAVGLIYGEIDTLLGRGAFSRVDELLRVVDTSMLPVLPLLAFVSITNAPRDRLAARASFVARVRQRITAVEPYRVQELLAGIE